MPNASHACPLPPALRGLQGGHHSVAFLRTRLKLLRFLLQPVSGSVTPSMCSDRPYSCCLLSGITFPFKPTAGGTIGPCCRVCCRNHPPPGVLSQVPPMLFSRGRRLVFLQVPDITVVMPLCECWLAVSACRERSDCFYCHPAG